MPPTRGRMWSRFLTITMPLFRSEVRWLAIGLLGLILTFIISLVSLNVLGSYMNDGFITSVEKRDGGGAFTYALLWAGLFAGITVLDVFKTFTEERLRLRWRSWLTEHLISRYLSGRAFFRLKSRADVDNPDQRITEDVKTFTDNALALLLIFTYSAISLILFAGVLWSITPWLCLAAVMHALFGSLMTVFLGRKLVKYDVHQFRKEADLRYDLIQVRTHAEPVALLGGEADEKGRLRSRLSCVVENMLAIIALSRNINFFTKSYDYLTLLLPLFIVGPMFIHGMVDMGKVTQSQQAFAAVMGAFSLIVKEFQRISTFGAVVERLGGFYEALEEEAPPPSPKSTPIETVEDESRVAFEGVTLVTPQDGRLIVADLTVEVPRGKRLLVLGPKGSGRTSILRAAAGLWTSGQGRIVRPPLAQVMFLPQQPYLRSGPLWEQLVYATGEVPSEERLLDVLKAVKFQAVLERVGGLSAVRDWPSTLSLGEQQQLAMARLLLAEPRYAFLDEPTSALSADKAQHLYEALSETSMTYISAASDASLRKYHDLVVELGPGGLWWSPGVRAASA